MVMFSLKYLTNANRVSPAERSHFYLIMISKYANKSANLNSDLVPIKIHWINTVYPCSPKFRNGGCPKKSEFLIFRKGPVIENRETPNL